MLPLALVYIVLIASVMLGLSAAGINQDEMIYPAILGSVNLAMVIILFVILDRGRLISPAYGRMHPREVERLKQLERQLEKRHPIAAEGGR
jgi:hypothetical protein